MGAGLQQHLGKDWGPKVWKQMAGASPNKVYEKVAECSINRVGKDRKRKATEEAKESRRKSKYQEQMILQQLAEHITGMIKELHLKTFLVTFLKIIWSSLCMVSIIQR